MARVTWEYAALYYLNWWLRYDRNYRTELGSSDPERQRIALCRAAAAYGVARNVAKAYDEGRGIARLLPVRDALMKVPRSSVQTSNVSQAVGRFRDRVSTIYGGADVLSLSTKFLWLRFRSPVRIYDRNVGASLGHSGRNIADYYATWGAEYAQAKEDIRAACDRLPELSEFCIDPAATPTDVAGIVNTAWFHERVFDIYHWHAGG